jgi:hypothetical protein
MAQFTRDFDKDAMGYSPDRVDALVWAASDLMDISGMNGYGVFDFYRQEAESKKETAQ